MSETLLEFPCEFPLKVMGRKEAGFQDVVVALVEAHTGSLESERIRLRESRDGNFIAVTVMIRAESQAQLDAIYRELSAHDRVLMAL
ncbi:MAG: YbeD family protein [Gammaproteobacteria bacterium]